MKFTVVTAAQRSPEWFAARAGRLTGSRAADMLATIKSGEAAARRDYRLQLATERLTGKPQENGFVSSDMQHGIDMEETAFAAYEAASGEVVRRTGFLRCDEIMAGCSLDGDIDDFRGIVEIKCPKSTTHVGYWKNGTLPAAHVAQITHNLWVSGAKWCDFVSFDDRLPAHLQLFVRRVHSSDLDIESYATQAIAFLDGVDKEVAAINAMRRSA